MEKDVKKLNKEIASFMLLSLALSAPVIAGSIPVNNLNQDSYQHIMLKYGAPTIPGGNTDEDIGRAISLYAVPRMPIDQITPIKPEPIYTPMYGVPTIPPQILKPENIIQETEKDSVFKPKINNQDLNSSLMNIEKNIESLKNPIPADIKTYMKKEDVINKTGDLSNIINNSGAGSPKAAAKIETSEFVYTNYGSYRTIEPHSYSINK